MKYANVFITLSIIIILLCGAAIGYIFYQENPDRYYRKGIASYESGNYEEAISALNDYVSYGKKNEKTEKARYYLAAAVDRRESRLAQRSVNAGSKSVGGNDFKLAKERYLDVINNNKQDKFYVEAVIGYGELCRKRREYDRFIQNKLENIIHSFPESKKEDSIFMLLGYQYLFGGESRKAMKSFLRSSLELAKLGQAEAHLQLNHYESAFKVFEDFLDFFPSSRHIDEVKVTYTEKVLHYADLHRKQEKYIEAISYYNKIIHYFPFSREAETARLEIGHSYYNMDNFEQAKKYYLLAFEDSSHEKDDVALFHTGLSSYDMGKYRDAYKYFNLLVNQFPRSIYAPRSRQWVAQIRKDLEYFNE